MRNRPTLHVIVHNVTGASG